MFRIERERRIGTEVEIEVMSGITSLSREEAGPARLFKINRDHWGIENGLHSRRDVTFREDACRIRKGSAGQLMAILRNLVISLLTRAGQPSLPAAIRHFVCHPMKALEILSSRE